MADPKEVQIAAVMKLAEIYALAYHKWQRAQGPYQTMVEAKARLYDGIAAAISNSDETGAAIAQAIQLCDWISESPHPAP